MTTPLSDEELRRELRLLCNQGRFGPVRLTRTVAAVLQRHGLAEQVSDAIWIPTRLGRSWCNADEALTPPAAEQSATSPPSRSSRTALSRRTPKTEGQS
jgi:hypothetical protein